MLMVDSDSTALHSMLLLLKAIVVNTHIGILRNTAETGVYQPFRNRHVIQSHAADGGVLQWVLI